MSEQFAVMGESYVDSFQEDSALGNFRRSVEIPSVFGNLGDLNGLSVCDFGCGTGMYSRLMKEAGASKVVGYDVCDGMLTFARAEEQRVPLGITYITDIPSEAAGSFDVVVSVYVLPYAMSYATLDQMIATMGKLLKPGGRLVTLPLNPSVFIGKRCYAPYGFCLSPKGLTDGDDKGATTEEVLPAGNKDKSFFTDMAPYSLFISGNPQEITALFWSDATLRACFTKAGLTDVEVRPHSVSTEGLAQTRNSSFWDFYLAHPHAAIYTAVKVQ